VEPILRSAIKKVWLLGSANTSRASDAFQICEGYTKNVALGCLSSSVRLHFRDLAVVEVRTLSKRDRLHAHALRRVKNRCHARFSQPIKQAVNTDGQLIFLNELNKLHEFAEPVVKTKWRSLFHRAIRVYADVGVKSRSLLPRLGLG
jgi:hypothetical protein